MPWSLVLSPAGQRVQEVTDPVAESFVLLWKFDTLERGDLEAWARTCRCTLEGNGAMRCFYLLARDLLETELQEGFPTLRRLSSSLVTKIIAVFDSFPESMRTRVGVALVKHRNPLGCSQTGDVLTADERGYAHEFMARFMHVPIFILRMQDPVLFFDRVDDQVLDGSYRPGAIRRPSKRRFRQAVIGQLREGWNRKVEKSGQDEFHCDLSHRDGSVRLTLDFGGWEQLRFDYSINEAKAGALSNQHFSLGEMLGFVDLPTDEVSEGNMNERIPKIVATMMTVQERLMMLVNG